MREDEFSPHRYLTEWLLMGVEILGLYLWARLLWIDIPTGVDVAIAVMGFGIFAKPRPRRE